VASFINQSLHPQGKSPWYPLDRRLGRPQSCSGCGSEEKKIPTPVRNQPSALQPVAQSLH